MCFTSIKIFAGNKKREKLKEIKIGIEIMSGQ